MRIINGYTCQSGCDERLAKQGVDPRNPHRDPVKQQQLDQEKALSTGKVESVVRAAAGTPGALLDRLA